MTLTASEPIDGSYEDFVRMHTGRFTAYLHGVLGRQAEGRGGSVPVADTLQEALLRIYAEWPELQDAQDDERDRRLYRCLRDAAGQALRAEHGRVDAVKQRVQIVPFSFDLGASDYDALPIRERELAVAVLGAMVRDCADGERETRAVIDRGILVAGLRALSEREAVVLLAVDYLRWDQLALAERLGLGFEGMRKTLFEARKLFYALVRHAAGVEADEEERGRLAAYLAGELTGRDKRVARRHLQHCKACQALRREQDVFGREALGVLAPLPFLLGAKVLTKRAVVKSTSGTGGAAVGFLAQPGAAKATAIVATFLSAGLGYAAWLARDAEVPRPGPRTASVRYYPPPAGLRRIMGPASAATASRTAVTKHPAAEKRHHPRKAASTSRNTTTNSSSSAIALPAATSMPSRPQQPSGTAGKSSGSKAASAGGWFGESP